jgi:hypothetical protein
MIITSAIFELLVDRTGIAPSSPSRLKRVVPSTWRSDADQQRIRCVISVERLVAGSHQE